jgi:HD-GYP domain-containing protein (c-di-GMP phosphodiesterase class II)
MNPMSSHPLLQTVRVLTDVLDAADPYGQGRSARMARWSLAVAHALGVPEAEWPTIELGARLHDLGRHALLNDVVSTPGALAPNERALVQTHPGVGADMLHGIAGLEAVAEIVHAHHERPDGKGYPRGLVGEAIPVGARIVMVCAAYDAMTEDRPYRRGLPQAAACDELQRHRGTQFFPAVVDAFVALLASGALDEPDHGDTARHAA